MDIVWPLLLQVVLIAINAFFAATEIALISLNEKKVRAQAEDGDKKAIKMLKIIENPTGFLSTIQVGITLAGFLGSAFAADTFAGPLTTNVFGVAVTDPRWGAINALSVVLITLILSFFTLVLGELVPKRVAMKHKDKLAASVSGFISGLAVLLKPVVATLSGATNLVLRMFGIDPHEKAEAVSEEDIVIMLDAGADEGTLNQDDIEYIKNVFKLDRLDAADAMTPRGSLVACPIDADREEILSLIENEGYSRIPVYEETVDKIVGILYAREFLLSHTKEGFTLADVLKKPVYVPEKMHLDVLLKEMQDTHNHMVVVVDEYGTTAGVVTMEDIIEELVGEIWDEQDEATQPIVATGEDTYSVESTVTIDEFFSHFELDPDDEIESSTVNGWVSEVCGNIAEVGFTFTYKNLELTVTEADEQMTRMLSVTVLPEPTDEDEEEPESKDDEE